jgi:transcriptional regulator with XRE-family HTH domain
VKHVEIYERIRILRKDKLKLSRDVFGERLGVSRDVIKNIELNALARPEQKEPLYKLICKEFNISYDWLTAGNGEMFIESEEAVISALVSEFNLDDMGKNILMAYKELKPEHRDGVRLFIEALAQKALRANAERAQNLTLSALETYGVDEIGLRDNIFDIFAGEFNFDNTPENTDAEALSLERADRVIEQANNHIRVYKAAESTTGKEHGVVSETQEDIDKMYKGKRVTSDDDF